MAGPTRQPRHHQPTHHRLRLPNRERLRAVLFDFDGTIADSIPAVQYATNEVLVSGDFAPISLAETLDGMRFDTARRHGYHSGVTEPERLAAMAREFFRVLTREPDRITLRSDMLAVVRTLRSRGVAVGIVSNNRADLISAVLRAQRESDVVSLFDPVLGEDTVDPRKPHPLGILSAMELLGVAATETVYVGDGESDAGAAERAGVACIGTTWAHTQYGLPLPEVFDYTAADGNELGALLGV